MGSQGTRGGWEAVESSEGANGLAFFASSSRSSDSSFELACPVRDDDESAKRCYRQGGKPCAENNGGQVRDWRASWRIDIQLYPFLPLHSWYPAGFDESLCVDAVHLAPYAFSHGHAQTKV